MDIVPRSSTSTIDIVPRCDTSTIDIVPRSGTMSMVYIVYYIWSI